MASLQFALAVAVLATVVALPQVQETTPKVITVNDRVINAAAACEQYPKNKTDNDYSCYYECVYKQMELLDKDGRYVESKAAEFLKAPMVHSPTGDDLTDEQVDIVAKACNSLNDNITAGCKRATQVSQCFNAERYKASPKVNTADDTMKNAIAACHQYHNQQPCFYECVFKQIGMLDKDGRYVESKAAEWLKAAAVHAPEGGILTDEQADKVAKACNHLNDNIAAGCQRSKQVSDCVEGERSKITGKPSPVPAN